ncbi:hypothetical protein ACA910_003858 [Epithemia clementina (nom. ined.)]
MAKSEVEQYLNYCATMDWKQTITDYPTDLFHKLEKDSNDGTQWNKQLTSYAKCQNIKGLWKYLDVLQWWNDFGRQYYPHVMMVASIALGRPYSNAQQEQDFSMATWFDGNLVQRQKPGTLGHEGPSFKA